MASIDEDTGAEFRPLELGALHFKKLPRILVSFSYGETNRSRDDCIEKTVLFIFPKKRGWGGGAPHYAGPQDRADKESARGAVGKPLLWVFGFVLWAGTGEAGQVG